MRILRPLRRLLQRSHIRYSLLFRWLEQLFFLNEKEKFIKKGIEFIKQNHIAGDFLEFGVYEGETIISAYHIAHFLKLKQIRFLAFDSFLGLPVITDKDSKFNYFKKGSFSCDEKSFLRTLKKNGVDLSRIITVKGWFKDSLTKKTAAAIGLKQAAFVYMDCDLYESSVFVLNFITHFLQDGSIIAFDDWFCFAGRPDLGEQRAFGEWLSQHPEFTAVEYHHFGWHGNSFIIHRRSDR